MTRLRISAISYLNTAPLMWDFEHGNAGRDFDISYTLPSACARALQAGTADIGIIPAAAYAQIPELKVLPGVAIASRRAVRSILLVSKLPIQEIRTVALDNSSLTSVALTKILFEKWLGGRKVYSSMPPDLEKMLAACDRRSRSAGRALPLCHAGSCRGVDSLHRKAVCVCVLGGARRSR
jgi:chorismate dehydratase